MPESLDELLEPKTTAHLVIDLQNDFCSPEGWAAGTGAPVEQYRQVIAKAVSLVESTRKLGVLQVFVKLVALPGGLSDDAAWLRLMHRVAIQHGRPIPDDGSYGLVRGSWGAELVDELRPQSHDVVIEKPRSSAFFETGLDAVLRAKGIRTLLFSGCTTEGCVESSVRDAGFHGYFAVVASDAVGSDVPDLHRASLRVLAAYRADVVTSDVIVRSLATNADRTLAV